MSFIVLIPVKEVLLIELREDLMVGVVRSRLAAWLLLLARLFLSMTLLLALASFLNGKLCIHPGSLTLTRLAMNVGKLAISSITDALILINNILHQLGCVCVFLPTCSLGPILAIRMPLAWRFLAFLLDFLLALARASLLELLLGQASLLLLFLALFRGHTPGAEVQSLLGFMNERIGVRPVP